MKNDPKRPRLGRGLSSLIRNSSDLDAGQYLPAELPLPQAASHLPAAPAPAPPGPAKPMIANLPLQRIEANPYQPRRSFDPQSLAELAESIRVHGVLQPILVAELPAMDGQQRYRLIAGERRLRAAQLAGVAELPCVIRDDHGSRLLELALVENIHRDDLNPIERAGAYRDLIDRFSMTQDQVAGRVGQPRSTVTNYLRLLDLSDAVQALILSGSLSLGHAKVLAGLAGNVEQQLALANRVVNDGLSVRGLEELVRQATGAPPGQKPDIQGQSSSARSPYLADVERQLSQRVGTRVLIRAGRAKHSGRIILEYYSLEDFDRIIGLLGANLES